MTAPKQLIIATRKSPLALVQTHIIEKLLKTKWPNLEIIISPLTCAGDEDADFQLSSKRNTKDLFTSELKKALKKKKADIAVHSLKDTSTEFSPEFKLIPVTIREDPRDVLVGGDWASLEEVPKGLKIGTSSPRRQALIRMLNPTLYPFPIRGNIGTRLRKLQNGECDLLILAAAALHRLGISEKIGMYLPVHTFVPAPAQGTLGIEIMSDNPWSEEILDAVSDNQTTLTTLAERTVAKVLEADCHTPLGVHAAIEEKQKMRIDAVLADTLGSKYTRVTHYSPLEEAESSGTTVANKLLSTGGHEIMQKISGRLNA